MVRRKMRTSEETSPHASSRIRSLLFSLAPQFCIPLFSILSLPRCLSTSPEASLKGPIILLALVIDARERDSVPRTTSQSKMAHEVKRKSMSISEQEKKDEIYLQCS